MYSKALEDMGEKSFPTPAALMVLEQGIMITPFVRLWSTTTKIESIPHTSGRSVMRSTESCLKGRDVEEGIGFRGGQTRWVFTLFCWHTVHPSMNLLT